MCKYNAKSKREGKKALELACVKSHFHNRNRDVNVGLETTLTTLL